MTWQDKACDEYTNYRSRGAARGNCHHYCDPKLHRGEHFVLADDLHCLLLSSESLEPVGAHHKHATEIT